MGADFHDTNARLASAGDADALQRLIVHCHDQLHRAVAAARSAALANRIDPEDVLQQAYITAFMTRCPTEDDENTVCERDADDERKGAHDCDASVAPNAEEDGDAGAGRATGNAALSSAPTFENVGHAYKWLEAVALNQLRDAERSLRRQKRDVAREVRLAPSPSASYPGLAQQLRSPDATPSRELRQSEAVAAMMSSLARLPATQRDVISWRFLDEVPIADIAVRLGKSEDAVYMICHRGLKGLGGFMGSVTRYLTRD